MTLLDNIALGYALGWSFTPLNGKRPILEGWQKRPRASLDESLQYAEQGNIGLRTGRISAPAGYSLVVIDQDAGGDVSALNLPPTVAATTGKGFHYYFYTTAIVGNTANRLGAHIDTRGEGGQVVYPGSVHPETQAVYAWLPGHSPAEMDVAILPQTILDRLQSEKTKPSPPQQNTKSSLNMKYALAALEYECDTVRQAAEGQRNDTLNKAAFSVGTLIAAGHLEENIAIESLAAAAHGCGLSTGEAKATIESGLHSGKQHPRQTPQTLNKPIERAKQRRAFMMTDLGNAQRLAALYGEDFRYCHETGQFLIWNGIYWQADKSGQIYRYAYETVHNIWGEARAIVIENDNDEKLRNSLIDWATKSQARSRLDAMVHLVQSLPEVPVAVEQLDKDRYLFNVKNGTINLRSGKLQPHDRLDYITQAAPVVFDPAATCPRWLSFLDRVMDHNEDLIYFLQQLAGYCLSGDVTEEIFPILYGCGQNGKSKFLDTLVGLMGPYAGPAPQGMLVETHQSQHSTDLAYLMGKRLIQYSETKEGSPLKVELIKQITGNQKLTARYMRQDNFSFEVTHKIIMETNHKPPISQDSEGIWRRIRLVPFEVQIPPEERDKKLFEKLTQEWPGILNWMLAGFLSWQNQGLCNPMEVVTATESYRDDCDQLGDFINDACVQSTDHVVTVAELREAYERWCEKNGFKFPISPQKFNERFEQRGFKRCQKKHEGKNARVWLRIGLNAEYKYYRS